MFTEILFIKMKHEVTVDKIAKSFIEVGNVQDSQESSTKQIAEN